MSQFLAPKVFNLAATDSSARCCTVLCTTVLYPIKVWSFLYWYKEHSWHCVALGLFHLKSWLLIHRLDFYANIHNSSLSLITINFIYNVSTQLSLMCVRGIIHVPLVPHTRLQVLPSIARLKPGLNRFVGKTGFARAKVQLWILWQMCNHPLV